MARYPFMPNCGRSETDSDDLAAVVVTARGAQIVRALQFATVRALVESFGLQRIMAAAHARRLGLVFLLGTAISAPVPENAITTTKAACVKPQGGCEAAPITDFSCVASASTLYRA
jgi:hypothetical protein